MLILKLFLRLLKINNYFSSKDKTPYFLFIHLFLQDVILDILAKTVANLKMESINI